MAYDEQKAYQRKGFANAIIQAGLLAGTLDILAAFAQFYIKTGKNPLVILRFIASAVLGKAAFAGGNSMLAIGLLFHYIIAFCWTALFFLLYPQIIALVKNKFIAAFFYGIVIWLAMNLLILPMTKLPKPTLGVVPSITGALILIVAIGIPVALLAKKYYAKRA